MVSFPCPTCGRQIEGTFAPDELAECPACGTRVAVSAMEADAPGAVGPGGESNVDALDEPSFWFSVAALVCGVLGLPLCFVRPYGVVVAAVGVVLGMMALRWAGTRGARRSAKAVTCVAAMSFVAGLCGWALLPTIIIEREDARVAACGSHLISIGKALEAYADANHGWLPPSFDVLDRSKWDNRVFECPDSTTPFTSIDSHYGYIPNQNAAYDPDENVVMYDKARHRRRDGGTVLFLDGHAEFIRPYARVREFVEQTRQRIAERESATQPATRRSRTTSDGRRR